MSMTARNVTTMMTSKFGNGCTPIPKRTYRPIVPKRIKSYERYQLLLIYLIFYVHHNILPFCMKYNATYKIFVFLQNLAFYCTAGGDEFFFYFFVTFDFDCDYLIHR